MPRLNYQKIMQEVFEEPCGNIDELILSFDAEENNPFITTRLTNQQIDKLVNFMVLLPFQDFQLLVCHHCYNWSYKKIESKFHLSHSKGKIHYIKDRLTQCMKLSRPIANNFWYYACCRAIDVYPFLN